jgi:hypothetical protein
MNAVLCLNCGDLICSEYVHDYRTCLCGLVSIDGGCDYKTRAGAFPFIYEIETKDEYDACLKHTNLQRLIYINFPDTVKKLWINSSLKYNENILISNSFF